MGHNITFTGILIAAVASWLFGAVYYTLLGRKWMAAQGKTEESCKAEFAAKSGVAKFIPFVLSFIGAVIMGVTLYGIMTHSGLWGVRAGAISGAFCWFGFIVTTVVINNAYQGRKIMLSVIDCGHWLGALIIIGGIVGWWGP